MRYFLKSISFALAGIYNFFKSERNGRIQGTIAVLMIIAGFIFKLPKIEWLFLLVCIGMVISLEMINSAIERVCNMHTLDFHPSIKTIKDVAAAAVLWSSIISALIGSIIFLPYIADFFGIKLTI